MMRLEANLKANRFAASSGGNDGNVMPSCRSLHCVELERVEMLEAEMMV